MPTTFIEKLRVALSPRERAWRKLRDDYERGASAHDIAAFSRLPKQAVMAYCARRDEMRAQDLVAPIV